MVRCPTICLSVPSIDHCSIVRQVCCWVPGGQEIIDRQQRVRSSNGAAAARRTAANASYMTFYSRRRRLNTDLLLTFLYMSDLHVFTVQQKYNLADYCKPTSVNTGRSHLQLASLWELSLPWTSIFYSDRSFVICGPSMWNSLPTCSTAIKWCLCRLLKPSWGRCF